jgi:hypothetical protein
MKILGRRTVAALGWTLLLPPSARADRPLAYDLATLPPGAMPYRVTAEPADYKGRKALKVALTEAVRNGRPGIDFGDTASFVILPIAFRNGTIEVDVLGRLAPQGPPDARAFAGLAYRIADDRSKFESVYLRPLNGLKANPPPPRDKRALQYFAYPDWRFARLREDYPDGRYESGADIAGDEWITLKLDIAEDGVRTSVNGIERLVVREPKAAAATGAVGLWVDIGTEAYFANLRVTPRI